MSLCVVAAARLAGAEPPLAEVKSGAFDIYVMEAATLDARQSVTIASELPSNSGKLAWLIDDGAFVKAGETIARFDAEPFREDAAKAEREYEEARAALAQANAELQILIQRGADQADTLSHRIALAELARDQLVQADRPLRIAAARNETLVARAALEQARQEAETQRRLSAEGFGSAALLAQAEAAEREKSGAVALAEESARLLEKVVLPSAEQEAALELERLQRELDTARNETQHSLAKQHAAILGLEQRVASFEAALTRARAALANTELVAPVSGFAIYVPASVGNAMRKAQVGDSVWQRHGFIVIPDMSALVATVRVREVDIGKIAPGQLVRLHPDAYADLELTGRVAGIGTMAERSEGDDGNTFAVRIDVDGVDARLRPGMRARAEILARRYTDVLRVPVEAVFRDRGESVCFVWDDDEASRRPITLGDGDGEYVVVTKGLASGERVLLSYPGAELASGP
jgi:HlyD family secretion protein